MSRVHLGLRPLALIVPIALLLSLLATAGIAQRTLAATAELTANLTGAQEVPPNDSTATGSATVSIDTDAAAGAQLCYVLNVSGLSGPATAAHIHEGAVGAAPASNIVVTLTIDATGSGTACAADADFNLANSGDPDIATLIADIMANPQNYYVNVHTDDFPAGEIRGQLAVAAAATGDVVVMKHLCNPTIQSEADFVSVENAGGGRGTVGGLVATVLACPTIVMAGDSSTPGAVTGGAVAFDFTVSAASASQTLSTAAAFEQGALCEDDVNLDADKDGTIEADVCLDVSMYAVSGVAEGDVTVTETLPPGTARFGTVRTTPGSGDDQAVVSATGGTIMLDTSADPDNSAANPLGLPEYGADRVTLHVYNFQAAAATTAPSATPLVSQLPNAAVDSPSGSMPAASWMVVLLGVITLVCLTGLLVGTRRRS